MNKTLYQIDSTGKTRVWTIRVERASHGADIVVEAGVLGGKMVETVTPITEGKNIGRSNETDPYTQACMDAQSEVDKKTTKGYVDDPSKASSSKTLGSGVPAPMLAQKFDPAMKQSGSKDLKKMGILGKRVFVQDKLDGNRCLALVTRDGTKLYTRRGKPFQPIGHIQDQLTDRFRSIYDYVNSKYGVESYWVDGELFTQRYSFNRVNGILKKEQRSAEDMHVLSDIGYHVYDVILPVGYETRAKVVQYFKDSHLHPVDTREVMATDAELTRELEAALARGQEGLMIRQPGVSYEHKRTWQLVKFKTFEDAEFRIVGFKRSITGDTLGSIQFELPNGDTFFARYKGTDDEQLEIWNSQHKYLGTTMTVEYFGMSTPEEGGKPRFPIAKGVRADD